MPRGVYVADASGQPLSLGMCLVGLFAGSEVDMISQVALSYSPGAAFSQVSAEKIRESDYELPLMHSKDCPCRAYFVCEGQHYVREKQVSLCACGIVESADGRLLLTRRDAKLNSFPKTWVFPGGHVDRGESADTAVQREIAEETGIAVCPQTIHPFLLYESTYPSLLSAGLPSSQNLIVFYHVKYAETAEELIVTNSEEVDLSVWLSREELEAVLQGREGHQNGIGKNSKPEVVNYAQISGFAPNDLGEGIGRAHCLAVQYWLHNNRNRD